MMLSQRRKLIAVTLTFLMSVAPVAAQERQLASLGRGGGVTPAGRADRGAPTTPAPAVTAEEGRARYEAKRKRRDALMKYLLSVNSESADYEATERAIRQLDGDLQSLAAYAPRASTREVEPPARNPATSEAPAAVAPRLAAILSAAPDAPLPAANTAPAQPQGLTAWLNARIDEKVKALINQNSPTKQTETPAISDSSTALVERASDPDLVGVALNLFGLTGGSDDDGDDEESSSVSATATAYALYAAFKGTDPLSPSFYNEHRRWRQVSFTLGYEKEQEKDGVTIPKGTLAGVKWLVIDKRDAAQNLDELATIREHLKTAGAAFGNLSERIQVSFLGVQNVRDKILRDGFEAFLSTREKEVDEAIAEATDLLQAANKMATDGATPKERAEGVRQAAVLNRGLSLLLAEKAEIGPLTARLKGDANIDSEPRLLIPANRANWTAAEREYFTRFRNEHTVNATNFQALLTFLSPEEQEALVDVNLDPFVRLNQTAREALERIRMKPQFSLAFQTLNRERDGDDEYKFKAIYEMGMTRRIGFTFNGGFDYVNKRIIGGDSRGGSAAGEFQFQVTPENSLISKSPIMFFLGGEGKWLSGDKPLYQGQAKVKIPVTDGVEVPLSLTYSSRTETQNSSDVKAQFSLTFDTLKLIRAFTSNGSAVK